MRRSGTVRRPATRSGGVAAYGVVAAAHPTSADAARRDARHHATKRPRPQPAAEGRSYRRGAPGGDPLPIPGGYPPRLLRQGKNPTAPPPPPPLRALAGDRV